jgi:hypothetical protein
VTTVGLRPPFVTPAAAYSHPDCRWILILIVAPQGDAAVGVVVCDQALPPPVTDRAVRDLKALGEFVRGQQAAPAKALMMARQAVAFAEHIDRGSLERLAFAGAKPATVEDVGNLLIAMVVEEAIDFSNDLGLELANLGHG